MVPLPPQVSSLASATGWRVRRPAVLYRSLLEGSLPNQTESGVIHWPVTLVEFGRIPLDTGLLVACDPYISSPDHLPFLRTLPAGEHLVAVAVVRIAETHRRTAAAVLCSRSTPVCSWELAYTDPEDLAALVKDDDFVGYGVDAATGCFANPSAFAAAVEVLADDDGTVTDPLSTALYESEHKAVVISPQPGISPVAMFATGWGDGLYPTWFGLDRGGDVSVTITDFLVDNEPDHL